MLSHTLSSIHAHSFPSDTTVTMKPPVRRWCWPRRDVLLENTAWNSSPVL